MSFVLLFFVLVYVTNLGYVMSDTTNNPNVVVGDEESKEVVLDPLADHTFVALLDIVFTDGAKRTCSGTIIHECVVITAAHCFRNPGNEMAKPELLASFVVIGTKKMFSSGYEHYLPIEKILIHPKYTGWTADLALVYTFASMTGHKPGTILPLAGERTSTHVDANVTVLSWGPSELVEDNRRYKYGGKSDCESDEDDKVKGPLRSKLQTVMSDDDIKLGQKDSEESQKVFKSRPDKKNSKHVLRSNPTSMREEKAKRLLGIDEEMINSIPTEDDLGGSLHTDEEIPIDGDFVTEPNFLVDDRESNAVTIKKTPSKKILPESSFNLRKFDEIANEGLNPMNGNRRANLREWPKSIYVNSRRFAEILVEQIRPNLIKYHNFRRFDQSFKDWSIYRKPEETSQPTLDSVDIKSHYKNWRRLMGTQQNQLKVDIFGFVNQKLCEGMVEKAMPYEFHLGNKNDVVCFSGDGQYVTDDDSGAPILRRGKLIAVAVGGVRQDDANVAVGMKMSCYCSWIVENLPEPAPEIACCYTCCEVTHLKDGVTPPQAKFDPKAKKIISF